MAPTRPLVIITTSFMRYNARGEGTGLLANPSGSGDKSGTVPETAGQLARSPQSLHLFIMMLYAASLYRQNLPQNLPHSTNMVAQGKVI